MATQLATLLSRIIEGLVRWIVVPVTSVIPVLVSSGILLLAFAALWLALGVAVVVEPGLVDAAWAGVGQLPLPIQGLAWLLFLPLMAGLWIWEADWPFLVRVGLVIALAAWNVLVLLPRREPVSGIAADAR